MPDILALVVVMGRPSFWPSFRESAWPGTRMPIVLWPGFKKDGSAFFRFTTSVSGPGQNFFASFLAIALNTPYFCAALKSHTKMDTGLVRGIFFRANSRANALLFVASQANP